MASSIDTKSTRYVSGGTVEVFPNRLGWWERKVLPFQNDDIVIVIDDSIARRPDLISQLAYGKTSFTWLVLQYNTILDVNTELASGKTIRLPAANRLI